MATDQDDDSEAPLDPATERVRRKMVRLLLVSVAVTMLGLMAVLAALVYRATRPASPEIAEGEAVPVALPADSQIREVSLDGERALLRLAVPEGETLLVLDLESGRVVGRYMLQPAP